MKRSRIVFVLIVLVFARMSNPLSAQNEIPNQEAAAEALRLALSTYDFTEFSSLLDDASTLVVADKGCIVGADSIISFMRNYCLGDLGPSLFLSLDVTRLGIFLTPYNFTPAVWICYFDKSPKYGKLLNYYVVFRMENGLIADMYLAEEEACLINNWSQQLPYSLDYFEYEPANRIKSRSNCMPCLKCGCKSEQLEWYWVRRYTKYTKSSDVYSYHEGEISVCPHCGRLVQYREKEKEMQCAASLLGKKAPEKETYRIATDNVFAQKGYSFQTMLNQIDEEWKTSGSVAQATVDETMTRLDALRLPNDGKLTLRLPLGSEYGFEKYRIILGSNSEFRINIEGESKPSFYGNLYAETTCMGAWQLYLLVNANLMLPADDDSNLSSPVFVFSESQLAAMPELKGRDMTQLREKNLIEPQVSIKKCEVGSETKYVADVSCCFWTNDYGLVRKYGRIVMDLDGCFERFISMDKTLLHFNRNTGYPFYSFLQVQPSIITRDDRGAAEALKYALSTYDFSEFSTFLTDNTALIVYGEQRLVGSTDILSYLQRYCKDGTQPEREWISDYSIFVSPNNYSTTLKFGIWDDSVLEKTWGDFHYKYMVFKMKEDEIVDLLLVDANASIQMGGCLYCLEDSWCERLPYTLGGIEFDERDGVEAQANAMPCFECGLKSEDLDWYPARQYYCNSDGNAERVFDSCLISICPKCGHLALYQYVCDETEMFQPKCILNNEIKEIVTDNPFAQIGAGYVSSIKAINQKWRSDELVTPEMYDDVMKCLDALRLPENGKLDIRMSGMDEESEEDVIVMNANYEFGVRVNGKFMPSLYGSVYADTTCVGAWQLFLMANAFHLLPAIWHGGYQHYDYVFCENDLYGISELQGRDIQRLVDNNTIEPQVSISKNKVGGETKFFADIYCCYWNDWQGLVCGHYRLMMNEDGCFERIFTMDQNVLHQYNCGIIF